MASATASLPEPQVLAHAKRRLFPDDEAPNTYAVTDTQFAQERWRPNEPIPSTVHETLAPFNHVRVGSGYPDLLGVRKLESELLSVERFGDEPPLIAVEAKGATSGGVDTTRGIVQAHDRLHEANAAYLAAPVEAISSMDRTLARELNVGVLGVSADGAVEVFETPRIVGNRAGGDANWIRVQASTQGVADNSFGLNHPKNYLGYPLALYADGPTDELLERYKIVRATAEARRGAAFLGLVEEEPHGPALTPLGREVVRFAIRRCGTVESALEEFGGWYRSSKRFCDLAPAWGDLARRVVFAYPATQLLIEELQNLADDGDSAPSLVDFLEYLHVLHPTFAVEFFLRGDDVVRRRVLTPDGKLRRDPLTDGGVYHSPTVFQLKAMCYHVGLLEERGAEPHRLEPLEDSWALRERL